MAEQAQEKRTFKWGDREYLLDDLLKLHAEQENHYYNFARDKGQYDATALEGLRRAISDRIGAVKQGQSFDGDGVLATDKADNTSIQTQKKGLFKKDKYVEQDNTEWAKYYLNKLVGQLNPYTNTAKDSGAWDLTKHGLGAYLTGQGLNAKDVFEKYDLRDESNPDNPRSFAQRDAELLKHLGGYRTWLQNKGFDFTKNDNEWDDDHMTTIDNLINNSDWSDRASLAANLRKIGAGDQYTTSFTSDRWDLSKSNEDIEAENKKKKEEDEAKLKAEHMKEAQDYFYSQKRQSNAMYAKPFDYSTHKFKKNTEANFENWYNDLNAKEQLQYGTHLGRSTKAWGNAWSTLMNSLKTGQQYTDKNLGVLLQGTFETQPQQFRDLGDGNYLIMDSVTDQGQGTVYNPNSGYLDTVFLGDIADRNSDIMDVYKNLAYKYANNKYNTNYDNQRYLFKEGGEIPKHQYGNAVNYNWNSTDQAIAPRAKANNLSVEDQKDRDRYTNASNKSVDNPDAGFTVAEATRLATIAADITSMFLDPVTGTAVGLGSTAANFAADIMDDGFQWSDVKNLGVNAGFDLLGAIPLFGDTVGTGTKITRQLIKLAPKAMAGFAAYQGIKNFDGMMESWGKLTQEDSKLTVQDWRNIAQSISLLTGGVRAVRNKAHQSKVKKAARLDDVVGINVVDKSGNMQQILVDGDVAKAVRNANGNKTEIEAILSDLTEFKGKFGENGTLAVNTKNNGNLQLNPLQRSKNADGSKGEIEWRGFRKEGKADVTDIYDFSRLPSNGVGRGYRIPGSQSANEQYRALADKYNSNVSANESLGLQSVKDKRGALTETMIAERVKKADADYEASYNKLLEDNGIEQMVNNVKTASDARRKYLENLEGRIGKTQSSLDQAQSRLNVMQSEADLLSAKHKADMDLQHLPDNNTINQAQNAIAHNEAILTRNHTKRQELITSRDKKIAKVAADFDTKIAKKKAEIKQKQKEISKLDRKKNKTVEDLNTRTKLKKQVNQLTNDIQSLQVKKGQIDVTIKPKIEKWYKGANKKLTAEMKTARGNIATAQPIAAQRQAMSEAYANSVNAQKALDQRKQTVASVSDLQKKLNTLQGRKASHDPATAHTQAFKDLEAMLANLRTSNSTVGGRNVTWDMNDILQKYGINPTDVFKQGGSIDINKINKFLNYAKR